MTSPEDRLRDLLRSSDVEPRGDGLSRIQARLVRRKRLRMLLLPSAALAVTGAVVAVLALGGSTTPDQTVTVRPGVTPETTAPAVAPGYDGPAIWPFPEGAPDDWRTTTPWAATQEGVAGRFLTDVVGRTGATVVGRPDSTDVEVREGERVVGVLHLEQRVGGAWTVVTAGERGTKTLGPAFDGEVSSPLTVKGSLEQGVDESIRVRLLTGTGRELGATSIAAGAGPWSGSLTWSAKDWTHGAVVGTTESAKGDGSLTRLFALPVRRGAVSALSEFAALQNGHVVLVGADGSPVRQVTYPPAGTRDRAPAYAAGRLLWVRQFAECDQSLLQLADGKATTLVSHAAGIRTPRLSTDGRVAAWVEGECGDGDAVVHVGNRTVPGSGFDSLVDVSDDGALLLRGDGPDGLGDVRYLPPGATDRDQAVALVTAVGCTATSAGTFDAGIAAWETCKDGQSRLVRHAVDGSRLEQGRLVAATDVQSAAAGREGQVLGVGTRSGGTAVALFADGKLTYVSTCAAGATDCLSSPDW